MIEAGLHITARIRRRVAKRNLRRVAVACCLHAAWIPPSAKAGWGWLPWLSEHIRSEVVGVLPVVGAVFTYVQYGKAPQGPRNFGTICPIADQPFVYCSV